jgi:hypothetical protein
VKPGTAPLSAAVINVPPIVRIFPDRQCRRGEPHIFNQSSLKHANFPHLTAGEGINRDVHFDHYAGYEQCAQRRGDPCFKRIEQRGRSILMLHKAFEWLNPSVLDGIKLFAEPEGHLDPRIRRRVIADVAQLHVVARCSFAPFEVLDYTLAGLTMIAGGWGQVRPPCIPH